MPWSRLLLRPDLLAFLALAALFLAVPEIDLAVSGLFYRTQEGFFLRDAWPATALYEATRLLTLLLALGLVGLLVYAHMRRRGPWPARRAPLWFLFLALLLGPGLLAHVVLKDHWDRARPRQVEQFGGDRQFSPPLLPTDQCRKNCSFVSGHAVMGFYLVAFGFVSRHRRTWLLAGLTAGAIIGLVRIVQGGHFLSDVIFAFYATWFPTLGLYAFMRWRGWLPPSGNSSV